jgi:hypothetical protein
MPAARRLDSLTGRLIGQALALVLSTIATSPIPTPLSVEGLGLLILPLAGLVRDFYLLANVLRRRSART